MGRRWLLFGVCLLAFSTAMWGQLPVVPGTDKPEHPQHTHRHDRRVNFGIKGGFTSSLFLVSDLVLNGTVIDEVQNNYEERAEITYLIVILHLVDDSTVQH